MDVTFEDITAASKRIDGAVLRTPCPLSIPLSEITGMRIFCKLELLQRTGSFKERGARNALELLDAEHRDVGVIAASAGNHALGLSYHARLLHIPVTVVMPKTAPLTKIENCKKLQANVILDGGNIEEARQTALALAQEKNLFYVNGYNDAAIIAGQGTMGLEIIEQVPEVDAVIVPIGGGGLIAGLGLALKTLRPSVRIIGVQPERVASYRAAEISGTPTSVSMKATLADGLAVPCVGDRAFALARRVTDCDLLVTEHSIALAVLRLMELEKMVVEGAGAVPLAACLSDLLPELKGKTVVLPLSGGNIDMGTVGRVIDRGLAADGRRARFSASISDNPGGLSHFAAVIAEEGASILDITHDRAFASEDITTVTVYCAVETRDHDHINQLRKRLDIEGFITNWK
jgi:threonine dehydratase